LFAGHGNLLREDYVLVKGPIYQARIALTLRDWLLAADQHSFAQ
jgi:hypothetical protein